MSQVRGEKAQVTKLIVALDVDNYKEAVRWVNLLYPGIKIFKVGLQLFTACGPKIIQAIQKTGAKVFLDLKFNDIPNTMVKAVKEALKYKVSMLTVHTLSGPIALKEVSRAARGSNTKILGVTILTSLCQDFLKDLKIQRSLTDEVLYLASMAKRCGLQGVVCSVEEAKIIRENLGKNFLIVTPGIRPETKEAHDQRRAATSQEAVKAGADYIVVGRPILEAKEPLKVVKNIVQLQGLSQ
ncbi:MAG: orotidine-5'-phosphate decarboxylase [Candidatus Omnitrophica bacterium]|nr:orotidine-5'-phosphate decarboxylase [Candidatus Omnitrophota bacterium]